MLFETEKIQNNNIFGWHICHVLTVQIEYIIIWSNTEFYF